MDGQASIKIFLSLCFSSLLFLLFLIFVRLDTSHSFHDTIYIQSGMLARYKTEFYQYKYVNVEKDDGTYANRNNDLEIMIRELLEYERTSKQFPGYYSDDWYNLEHEVYQLYDSQDIKTMRELIELERNREWKGAYPERQY